MTHLSYFGTQILPTEIFLFIMDFSEVSGVLSAEFQHLIYPALLTVISLLIGFFAIKRFKDLYTFKFIPFLIIAYFIYNPVRTYVTGNTWGRQPSTRELGGMNVYLSMSYFMGRILPHKLKSEKSQLANNDSLKLNFSDKELSKWDNIIIVLGESLTPHHMSLFGYERPTTPYLDSLKNNPEFFHTIGLSSGVSTDISVAFFLNMGYGEAGGIKASKAEHCLFKLAKENGFKTHFLSSQSGQQLRYIAPYLCTAYLDDYRSLEDVSPQTENDDAAIDRHLLPKLNDILSEKKSPHFIILHQRGSHGPWALRFTNEAIKFTEPSIDQRINNYDNSVVEYDLFWKELNPLMSKYESKNLIIYLSDHGESLGVENRWGHGFLRPAAFEIPILIHSYNRPLPDFTRELPKNMPQYNLSLYIATQIGYKANQDFKTPIQDFIIFGNDIDGFAGKAEIKFAPDNSYELKVIP